MMKRCSCACDADEWKQYKIARFRHHLLSESVVRRCEQVQVGLSSVVATAVLGAAVPLSGPAELVCRLVLPYQHAIRMLPSAVYRFMETRNQLLSVLGIRLRIQICWSKGGRALHQLFI